MAMLEGMPDGEITGSRIKIGAEKHHGRTIMWIVGALASAVGIFVFYRSSASNDEPKLRALAEFRSAFAQKCNSAEFGGPTPAFVKDQFLNSTALQEAVTKQAAALQGGASCADVEQGLRAASFPMSAKPGS